MKQVVDSWITAKVKAAIFNEPSLKATRINVETCKHVVQLSGFVDATASMNKAVAITRSVKGVIVVTNHMQFR
jgi:osmotically-inducible protein OsmY